MSTPLAHIFTIFHAIFHTCNSCPNAVHCAQCVFFQHSNFLNHNDNELGDHGCCGLNDCVGYSATVRSHQLRLIIQRQLPKPKTNKQKRFGSYQALSDVCKRNNWLPTRFETYDDADGYTRTRYRYPACCLVNRSLATGTCLHTHAHTHAHTHTYTHTNTHTHTSQLRGARAACRSWRWCTTAGSRGTWSTTCSRVSSDRRVRALPKELLS